MLRRHGVDHQAVWRKPCVCGQWRHAVLKYFSFTHAVFLSERWAALESELSPRLSSRALPLDGPASAPAQQHSRRACQSYAVGCHRSSRGRPQMPPTAILKGLVRRKRLSLQASSPGERFFVKEYGLNQLKKCCVDRLSRQDKPAT